MKDSVETRIDTSPLIVYNVRKKHGEKMTNEEIRKKLFEMKNEEYKLFQCKLMPNISPDTVIGVRIPQLRKFAKELYKGVDTAEFLSSLPHKYYEENNLHAFIIEQIKTVDECIEKTDRFLPYVDNWATCDSLRPKCFKYNVQAIIPKAREYIVSSHTYTARFGIELLMLYCLDEHFDEKYPLLVSQIESTEYYVNMMRAWYFATALAKQYESVIKFIESRTLDTFTHGKTIKKACESFRIPKEIKEYLKTLL